MLRWRMLLLLFVARVGLGFQFQTMGSVGDDFVREFGLDHAAVGTLIGLFMLPGLFLAIPAGLLGRYCPDRLLCGGGLAALAVGGLIAGFAPDPWLVGAGRMVCGLGFVFSTLYFVKMTVDWFVGREIATAMAILVMSWPFGIAMGQIAHEWLAATGSWRWPFFVASAYCAFGALAIFALYRPPPAPPAPPAPEHVLAGATKPKPAHAWALLSRRELSLTLIAALIWGFFNAGYVIYLNFGPAMLEAKGYGPVEAAAVISIASWVMIFSGAVCGQITDRTRKPAIVVAVAMVVAMAALAALGQSGADVWASLAFGLIGMAPAGVIMALTGEAMRPESRAIGMGVFFTGYYVIMTAAPPLAGWLYDQSGDPFAPLQLGVAMFALVLLAYLGFRLAKGRLAKGRLEVLR